MRCNPFPFGSTLSRIWMRSTPDALYWAWCRLGQWLELPPLGRIP
jgi:hypothetical protein